MNDDIKNMTNEELWDEVISWAYETRRCKDDKMTDVLFNMGYIQEYLQEITDRAYAVRLKDE